MARLAIVGAGTFADVQISDTDTHTVRLKGSFRLCFRFHLCSGRSVDHIAIVIENAVAGILVGLGLCIGENAISAHLRFAVGPCLTDTVITGGQLLRIFLGGSITGISRSVLAHKMPPGVAPLAKNLAPYSSQAMAMPMAFFAIAMGL